MLNRHSSTDELTRWQLFIENTLNVAAIFALVCGGIWALYEFFTLRSAETAEAELRKLQLEISQLEEKNQEKGLEIKKLQIATERLPVIEVKVDAKVVQREGKDQLIEINVLLANQGKLKEILNLEKDPLRIYPVVFQDCHNCLSTPAKPWLKSGLEFPRITHSVMLLPGAKQRFRALYKAPVPGMYFVEFVVELRNKSLEQWKGDRDISNPSEFKWADSVFVEVPNQAKP